jgi:hypothetical protein
MAFVICCVFFTDLIRRRMSSRFGIYRVTDRSGYAVAGALAEIAGDVSGTVDT